MHYYTWFASLSTMCPMPISKKIYIFFFMMLNVHVDKHSRKTLWIAKFQSNSHFIKCTPHNDYRIMERSNE